MGVPSASILPATNITDISATLNAKIADDGGVSCLARFRWRKVGEDTWNLTQWQDSLRTDDEFDHDLL